MALGKSADLKEKDPVLVASFGGADMVAPVHVAARREFAGSWEYLLDEAIFTTPPHPAWSGAALINREGKLVGVGSLIVRDVGGKGDGEPGNMFVPIDRLPPILADLIAEGRVSGPARPWLGVTAEEVAGRLLVARVTAGGPAEKAGVQKGDILVGVGGETGQGPRRFLPQGVGARRRRHQRAARRAARQRRQAHRRAVHEPAGPPEAQVDVLRRDRVARGLRAPLPLAGRGRGWGYRLGGCVRVAHPRRSDLRFDQLSPSRLHPTPNPSPCHVADMPSA